MADDRATSKAHWGRAYQQFRKRLVSARESAGLTQREAARLIGRSQSFIAKSESGERRVDVVELARFAALYGKPLNYFSA
jgi:transcriptional regulator with XRE-family HTH domain